MGHQGVSNLRGKVLEAHEPAPWKLLSASRLPWHMATSDFCWRKGTHSSHKEKDSLTHVYSG